MVFEKVCEALCSVLVDVDVKGFLRMFLSRLIPGAGDLAYLEQLYRMEY